MIILEVFKRADDEEKVCSPVVTNMVTKHKWGDHLRSDVLTSHGLGAVNVITGYFKLGSKRISHNFFGVNSRGKILK